MRFFAVDQTMIIIISLKKLAKEFEGEFNCLGGCTVKNKTYLVPITKEVKRIDKSEKEIIQTISYKLQFIDNARFIYKLTNKSC